VIDFFCLTFEDGSIVDTEEYYLSSSISAVSQSLESGKVSSADSQLIEKAMPPSVKKSTDSKISAESFKQCPDLASIANGGKILFATDDFFAVAENMINETEPVWTEEYTEHGILFNNLGKWMDGWETRRKRIAGHDWCIIELGLQGEIVGVDADTAFFTGNNVPAFSIQGACLPENSTIIRRSQMGTCATVDECKAVDLLGSDKWKTILEKSNLGSGIYNNHTGFPETRHNLFKINDSARYTHIRVNIFPDGGLARLRVYGNVVPDWPSISSSGNVVDMASLPFGYLFL
jgi:allantoicase